MSSLAFPPKLFFSWRTVSFFKLLSIWRSFYWTNLLNFIYRWWNHSNSKVYYMSIDDGFKRRVIFVPEFFLLFLSVGDQLLKSSIDSLLFDFLSFLRNLRHVPIKSCFHLFLIFFCFEGDLLVSFFSFGYKPVFYLLSCQPPLLNLLYLLVYTLLRWRTWAACCWMSYYFLVILVNLFKSASNYALVSSRPLLSLF